MTQPLTARVLCKSIPAGGQGLLCLALPSCHKGSLSTSNRVSEGSYRALRKSSEHVSSPARIHGPGNPHTCTAGVRTDLVQVKPPLPSVYFGPLAILKGRQIIGDLHCAGLSSFPRSLQPIFTQHSSGRHLGGLQGTASLLGPCDMGWNPSLPIIHVINFIHFIFTLVVFYALLFQALEAIHPNPLCPGLL